MKKGLTDTSTASFLISSIHAIELTHQTALVGERENVLPSARARANVKYTFLRTVATLSPEGVAQPTHPHLPHHHSIKNRQPFEIRSSKKEKVTNQRIELDDSHEHGASKKSHVFIHGENTASQSSC
jgi:hypothetical protein